MKLNLALHSKRQLDFVYSWKTHEGQRNDITKSVFCVLCTYNVYNVYLYFLYYVYTKHSLKTWRSTFWSSKTVSDIFMQPLCFAGMAFTLSVLKRIFCSNLISSLQVLRFDHLRGETYVDLSANPHGNSFTTDLMVTLVNTSKTSTLTWW